MRVELLSFLILASPSLAADPPVVITVDRAAAAQTIDGLGDNAWAFVWASDLGHDAARELAVLDDSPPPYVRLAGWFSWWETSNDDADPHHLDVSRMMSVHDTPRTHDRVAAADLTRRHIEVTLGIWDPPPWMLDATRQMRAGMAEETAESIASYVRYLEDGGARVSTLSVQNEPAIVAGARYPSPEALRDTGRAVVRALDRMGLEHVRLHGPDADRPSRTLAWARPWLDDEVLRARTAALSFHTWWDDDEPTYRAIAALAAAHHMPVWVTEDGACAGEAAGCDAGSAFRPSTWATAWDTANSVWRALAWAHASRVYHWSLVGNGGSIAAGGARTPTFSVYAQLAHVAPAGAHVVEVKTPAGVRALAFDTGATLAVLLIADAAVDVTLRVPACTLRGGEQSTEGRLRATLMPSATTALPAHSITTVELACAAH